MFARIVWATAAMAVFAAVPAKAQTVVGQNSNAVGPFADGFYSGIPHYQDNEPHCDRNPLLPANIVCMVNGYNGTEDLIGDAWPKILESQDNARTWLSRFASGHAADAATDLGLGFGADPIMVCFPGGCAGFFIASTRSEGGGQGGGVYMELMPEINIEAGFRHPSLASGPRAVQLASGDNFLDKIDALFMPDTQNPGTISVTETVSLGNGETREITRKWPKGRFIVVYASFNSSNQNVRIFSTYSDDYGLSWDPPKQVAQTTGLDTGVAITSLGDTVLYAYRQFQDDSGDQTNAVFAAVSPDGGKRIGKAFPVLENFCPFDQVSLPNEEIQSVVAPRTNNFVDVSNDGENFVMVLASRLEGPGGCLDASFDYLAGSRVLVTAAPRQNPKNWSKAVELAPVDPAGPAGGHSFQFMPAVDCVLGVCQSIWYDSLRDSARNIAWLESFGEPDDVEAFKSFPFFGDFLYEMTSSGDLVQFRRTADIYGRQFEIVSGNSTPQVVFNDVEPVRITRFTLFAPAPQTNPGLLLEIEQLPAAVKQYGGNLVPFLGDYLNLASQRLRIRSDSAGPNGEPHYESNAGIDPANPNLRAKWWASWTDTRNAAGQLYTDSLTQALPFAKTPTSTITARVDEESEEPAAGDVESKLLSADKELGAEGVEDSGTPADVCVAPAATPRPGSKLFVENNKNRIKDADIFGALIEQAATAWVLNGTKGFGPDRPQRAFVIAARNENENESRTFRFEIANQPEGFDDNKARASWQQLPFENFDNEANPPDPSPPDETVGPQSSVTVALFVVSEVPINPVTVNVYDVITDEADPPNETLQLVETLVVNGEVEAGPLITPFGAIDVNQSEIHNPFVYDPFTANPAIWNPAIWNPAIWNPAIWNPAIWNPAIWNPAIWNPAIWNPAIWNPAIWNPTPISGSASTLSTTASSSTDWDQQVIDANYLDNPEIPQPDLTNLVNPDAPLVAKVDVQFAAENQGNTLTPYVADFAVNSPIVRDLLAKNKLATQLIVWEDARTTSFQGCTPDEINGQTRVIAVANNPDLANLKVPDIVNNRFGSITYYLEPRDQIYLTLRFIGSEAAVRQAADALFTVDGGGISYVITSQAANTGSQTLRTICTGTTGDEICDQAIKDLVPPTLTLNADPVLLPAILDPAASNPASADIGAILPASLVTATGSEFEGALPVTCSSDALASDVVFDQDSPADQFVALPLGTVQFSCTATRNAGTANEVTASIVFDVTVEDKEPPVLGALPASFTLERELPDGTDLSAALQPAAAVWDGLEDLPTATDNIDTDLPVNCEPVAPGGIAPFVAPGPTATDVTCTATDGAGNPATAGFSITVRDTTPPVINPIDNIAEEAASPAGTEITILPPGVIEVGTLDALGCTATINGTTVSVIGTTLFPIGATVVDCDAQDDAGNLAATVLFTVTVEDNVPPAITEVPDFVGENAIEANTAGGANLSFTAPTATDFEGTVTLEVSCDRNPTGDLYRLYAADGGPTTTVTCTATDGFNTATETFDVTVVDTTPPDLTVPADRTVPISGSGGSVVEFEATATDIADPNPTVTCTPASGDLFPQGTTTVDCEAVDASGNDVADTFSVTVELGTGSGLSSNKKAVKAGSVAPFTWAWTDGSGNPVDIGEGNQDIEARPKLGKCPSASVDVLDEDPGSSGFRKQGDNSWQYNWQTVTVDDLGNTVPINAGDYCVEIILLTTGQRQLTEIKVTP